MEKEHYDLFLLGGRRYSSLRIVQISQLDPFNVKIGRELQRNAYDRISRLKESAFFFLGKVGLVRSHFPIKTDLTKV